MVIGPFALPAMWIGMGLGLSHWRDLIGTNHRGRVAFLLAAAPLAILLGHSLLYWRGMLSSSGELRYLLVAAPMWGILTAQGWEWIFDFFSWPRAASWAALAAVATGLVNFPWRILPVDEENSWQQAHRAVAWYLAGPLKESYPRVLSDHPGIFYYLDVGPAGNDRVERWCQANIDHPSPGVILLWDPIFAVFNADPKQVITLDRVIRAGWIEDWRAEWSSNVNNPPPWANSNLINRAKKPADFDLPDTTTLWHIFRSPLDRDGHPTAALTLSNGKIQWRQTPGNPTPRADGE